MLSVTTSSTPSRFADLLTPFSRVKYLLDRLLGWPVPVVVALRSGTRIRMRPFPSTTDYGVAYEIFYHRMYRHPWLPNTAGTIVDLGGNVGYSTLWWCSLYPDAHVIVYEPMPEHVALIGAHVRLNGLESRVAIRPVAAGAAQTEAVLEPLGARSVLRREGPGIRVPVVDIFEELSEQTIDVLKIDIEGSEHQLLADERFANLRVRVLVMEWHTSGAAPRAQADSIMRLESAGYEVESGPPHDDGTGMLWARRGRPVALNASSQLLHLRRDTSETGSGD
jgi:FkbM family methyltransferase